jgi:heme/copper-type cytochrome/quinol oxidase subunit 3
MHNFHNGYNLNIISLILVISSMSFWFRDIISEGTFLGNHTLAVQKGLNLGVILFIVSEALFFLAIFWAFFHSALTPTVELGAQWPPIGIEPVNPFELPLLNTVILLSSGATVTYAHHSLIYGERKGALYGSIATVLLAIIFTVFQGVEYNVSSFTISDGAFGTCFFFGTGFHGSITHAASFIFIYIIHKTQIAANFKISYSSINNNELLITLPNTLTNKPKILPYSMLLSIEFIEWFVGFTDGEGNFNIKLTDLTGNTFKNVQFTFQIGLHKDEIEVLEYIMKTLQCGHISKSQDKINYFVNDINSLLHVIIPIFDSVNLNSSKFHHYELFKKAVLLTKDKSHLSDKGKLDIIAYQKKMQSMSGKWMPSSINNKIKITRYWLAGFIDAEASFSTNKYVPRFKLENHIKELELYNKIKEFFNVGNVLLSSPRVDRVNSNPTIILEINKVQELRENLIPLLYDNDYILLKTLKAQDFLLWLKLVNIYYKGYHTILEGKYIFDAIKLHINKYRLTTNTNLYEDKNRISLLEIDKLLSKLYLIESPYETKEGIRYYRNTTRLVSESVKITAIDKKNNKKIYESMSECAKDLKISRKKIKECLNTGDAYIGYVFVLV